MFFRDIIIKSNEMNYLHQIIPFISCTSRLFLLVFDLSCLLEVTPTWCIVVHWEFERQAWNGKCNICETWWQGWKLICRRVGLAIQWFPWEVIVNMWIRSLITRISEQRESRHSFTYQSGSQFCVSQRNRYVYFCELGLVNSEVPRRHATNFGDCWTQ